MTGEEAGGEVVVDLLLLQTTPPSKSSSSTTRSRIRRGPPTWRSEPRPRPAATKAPMAARMRPCRRGGARARAARPRGRAGGRQPPPAPRLAPAGAGGPQSGVSAGGEAGTAAGWEAALEALRAAGPAADGPLYATAIGACCEAGEFAKAAELHKAFRAQGAAVQATKAFISSVDEKLGAQIDDRSRAAEAALASAVSAWQSGQMEHRQVLERILGWEPHFARLHPAERVDRRPFEHIVLHNCRRGCV